MGINWKNPKERSKKISNTLVEWYKTNDGEKKKERLKEKFLKRIKVYTNTRPHLILENILRDLDLEVHKEAYIGGYSIDCYIPKLHLGFEADGPYHIEEKDNKRDSALFNSYYLPIIRLSAKDLIKKDLTLVANIIKDNINKYSVDSIYRKRKFDMENPIVSKLEGRYFTPGNWIDFMRNKTYEEIYGEEKAKEICDKLSKSHRGKKYGSRSDETRKRISDAKLRYYAQFKKRVQCPQCKDIFTENGKSKKKFCSVDCYLLYVKTNGIKNGLPYLLI